MAPKKGAKGGKKDEGPVEDEATILKRKVTERDAEIVQLLEKLQGLEENSQELAGSIEQIRFDAIERAEQLQDIIIYLTGQVKIKGERTDVFEKELASLRADKTDSIEALVKELGELKHNYKFALEDLRLQLDNAQVQLRDLNEFTMTKAALEQETISLKEQLEKEKKDHQESISDVERATLQERERLKKEMAVRIEDTRKLMIKQAHEQLHAKTKKTILENEQLSRELIVHIRQTEQLLHRNEKLVEENIDMHRCILLAKELEEDLTRRNETCQKTMRILVFKLREKHLANKMERKMEEEELKQLIGRNEALKTDVQGEKQQLEKLREMIETKSAAAECSGPAEESMKFLYACMEDLEVERLVKARADGCMSGADAEAGAATSTSAVTASADDVDASPNLPSSLELLTLRQRKGFLRHLIRTAISLRAATRNFESLDPVDMQELETSLGIWKETHKPAAAGSSDEGKKEKAQVIVSVEDILGLPLGCMELDNSIVRSAPHWIRPTSAAAQTDYRDVNPAPSELF